ncbi:MAG: hypothetical protein JWO68_2055 [Actinomycetia bacterium]|nr:hypothetical protein [Actinomycetes bacterium]
MIWLLTRPVVWPVKTAGFGLSTGYKTGRLLGYRRVTVFLLGVAVGLLVAPFPGRDLRALLQERLRPTPPPPPAPVDRDEPIDLTSQGV